MVTYGHVAKNARKCLQRKGLGGLWSRWSRWSWGIFSRKKKSKKNKISLEYREENLEVSSARISGVTIDCFRLLASSPVSVFARFGQTRHLLGMSEKLTCAKNICAACHWAVEYSRLTVRKVGRARTCTCM